MLFTHPDVVPNGLTLHRWTQKEFWRILLMLSLPCNERGWELGTACKLQEKDKIKIVSTWTDLHCVGLRNGSVCYIEWS